MTASIIQDPVLHLTLRASLALLFASAAIHKARDFPLFRETLRIYRVLPEALVPLAAGATLGAELFVAVALLAPLVGVDGASGALVLLAIYSMAIAINLARGRREIDCGCGGPASRQPISGWLLARNLLLAGVAFMVLTSVRARPLLWLDWLTMASAVGVFALAWDAGHRLLAEWERIRPHLQHAAEAE